VRYFGEPVRVKEKTMVDCSDETFDFYFERAATLVLRVPPKGFLFVRMEWALHCYPLSGISVVVLAGI
jgi:hypothetical protein